MSKKGTQLDKAKVRIVLKHGMFAPTLMQYPFVARTNVALGAIDRRGQIYLNPDEVEKLPVPQVIFLLCHEVLHKWGADGARRGPRDPKIWNQACDAYNNDVLIAEGIGEPIPGGYYRDGARNFTKEEIYDQIIAEQQQQQVQGQPGKSGGQPGNQPGQPGGQDEGEDEDGNNPSANSPAQDGEDEGEGEGSGAPTEWPSDLLDEDGAGGPMTQSDVDGAIKKGKMLATEAAIIAKSMGKGSGALAEYFSELIESRVHWAEELASYMTGFVKQETSWLRPDRRFISSGILLPSAAKQPSMGNLLVQCDVSGSIRREYPHFNGHIKKLVELCNPDVVDVIYVDTDVVHHDHYENDELEDVEIRFRSGGGTDMPAGLDWIEQQPDLEPDLVIVFTDGETNWPTHAYPWPVVWVISQPHITAPVEHGQTITFHMDEE